MKGRTKPPEWESYVNSLIQDCGEKGARKNPELKGKAPRTQPQEHESGDIPSRTLNRKERKMKGLCGAVGGIQLDIPYISGHALLGWCANHPMRLIGSVESTPIKILVDSSSTHNFLNPAKVARMSCSAVLKNALEVSTGDGSHKKGAICKGFKWRVDNIEFESDMIGLNSLEVCDVVLGNQWLATLGTVVWDFKQSRIGFTYQGKRTVLKSYAKCEWQKVGKSLEIDDLGNGARIESDIACISAHSLYGCPANIPMRLKGFVQSTPIKILVDLNSTHNFLNLQEVLRKVKVYSVESVVVAFRKEVRLAAGNEVEVAGGACYKGKHRICKGFKWKISNIEFESDMVVLPLEKGDIVLGSQWLGSLGPICWDFKQCRMQIAYQGEKVVFELC